jgi:single-strand DNA-binding protein
MATNDALFSVTGYVATQPKKGLTKSGTKTLTFRIGWTPREVSRQTGEWADLPSSFASVTCYRKIAENAAYCLRKGDPIVLKGTLRVREYADQAGTRRNSVDVVADFLGHDLMKGTSMFTKQPQRAQQTADEYELSQLADGNRLPGDVAAAQLLDGQQPEVIEPGDGGLAVGADTLPDDLDQLAHVALDDPDRDDIGDPDGDDPDQLGEFGDSEGTKSRRRSRTPEPVGVGA